MKTATATARKPFTVGDIIESASGDHQRDRQRYADLMLKGEFDKEEAAELHRLIDTLGKTRAQLDEDEALARSFRQFSATIALACGKLKQREAAKAAMQQFHEKRLKIQEELRLEQHRLFREMSALDMELSGAEHACATLSNMRQSHRDLFGHVEVPTITD
jgi:chromosome segregation ATPase